MTLFYSLFFVLSLSTQPQPAWFCWKFHPINSEFFQSEMLIVSRYWIELVKPKMKAIVLDVAISSGSYIKKKKKQTKLYK